MLHIILGILKVIGIIIGVILLLLCTVLLSILFVPLRYRAEAVKEPEQADVKLRVTWFLRAVSVLLYADVTGVLSVTVRLFGIRFPLNAKKRRRSVGKKSIREKGQEWTEEGIAEISDAEASTVKIQAIPEKEKVLEETRDISQPQKTAEKSESTEDAQGDISEEDEVQEDLAESIQKQKRRVYKKIRCKIRAVCDKIKKVTEAMRHLIHRLKMLPKKLAYTGKRLGALLRKPEELVQLARKYEVKENWQIVCGYLRFLWKHFRPRSISGYLHFGTDDPALTGQLTGIIYMLLPARAGGFEIMPEFDGAVFETHIVCIGRIRCIHLIRVLIRGFCDEHLRRLIRTIRSGK